MKELSETVVPSVALTTLRGPDAPLGEAQLLFPWQAARHQGGSAAAMRGQPQRSTHL